MPDIPQELTSQPPTGEDVSFATDSEPVGVEFEQGKDKADDVEVDALGAELVLTEEEEKNVCAYMEENLPKMMATQEETDRIKTYLSMYDQAVKKRSYPYDGAPSTAVDDATQKVNQLLDEAETAFLQQPQTWVLDRDAANLEEEQCARIEQTVHRNVVKASGLYSDLRLMLFESFYLGVTLLAPREHYDIRPIREKVIIRDEKDLLECAKDLTSKQLDDAKDAIASGKLYVADRDVLKMVSVGVKFDRIDQTKFLYPRNTNRMSEWQIVAEKEFYVKSALMEMAERGLISVDKLNEAIEKRKEAYSKYKDEKGKIAEDVKPSVLDSDWTSEYDMMQEMGDAYDDEFAVYRVTMLYNAKTAKNRDGRLRSWVQFSYCPAGNCILSAQFCPEGEFPYFPCQFRPIPHRAFGPGVAHFRFNANEISSDLLSLFMACIEQEIGTPLLIRETSGLFATDFRMYPGATAYTGNPREDAVLLPFQEKSRLAVEGMKILLGGVTGPDQAQGAGYASGKKAEILQKDRITSARARLFSFAQDLDKAFNYGWKIICKMSKLNRVGKKYLDWVYAEIPKTNPPMRYYVLDGEMRPELEWTCSLSAVSLTPEARLQEALMMKQILHDNVPAAVNSPRLTIGWSEYIAGFFKSLNPNMRAKLLPNEQDFQIYQAQLGQMGGQREQAPATQATAQSKNTPFRNPAAGQQKAARPQ